jgi:hypothetical protein
VERIFSTTSAAPQNAADQAGHQSGCRSEARTPSAAAMKSPANGARWRKGNKEEDAISDM